MTKRHLLFFGDPDKGASYCIELPEAPTTEQQENLRKILNLYYVQSK